MVRRFNGKKLNFKQIYAKIAKYGKLISEVAADYDMTENDFRARIERGLDPKLYSVCLKADERNKIKITSMEDKKMHKQSTQNTQPTQPKKIRATRNTKKVIETAPNFESLEKQQNSVVNNISKQEQLLAKAEQVLAIRQQALADTQKVYDEIAKALATSQEEVNEAQRDVERESKVLEELNQELDKVTQELESLKNKNIYLVAPGYTGNIPEFGTFYSTTAVNGIAQLQITEASAEYAIEPQLKDMVVAGYDSYKEYMEGLRFTMLCLNFTIEGKEYTTLVSDEKLQKLMQIHIS